MGKFSQFGEWALVTGASAGIGREFARQLAAGGLHVAIVARREDRLHELASELHSEHGVEVRPIAMDLATDDCVERVFDALNGIAIDVLVNNAGFGDAGSFWTRDPGQITKMVKLNCLTPALLTRAFLPGMVDRDRGAVIMVSSVLGMFACPYEGLYGATKAFDLSLGESIHHELKGTKVAAVTICPSITDTEFLLAEGVDPDRVRKMYRRADSAEKIARITLKALGRKSTVGPRDFHLTGWAQRFVPRTFLPRVVGLGMKKQLVQSRK